LKLLSYTVLLVNGMWAEDKAVAALQVFTHLLWDPSQIVQLLCI